MKVSWSLFQVRCLSSLRFKKEIMAAQSSRANLCTLMVFCFQTSQIFAHHSDHQVLLSARCCLAMTDLSFKALANQMNLSLSEKSKLSLRLTPQCHALRFWRPSQSKSRINTNKTYSFVWLIDALIFLLQIWSLVVLLSFSFGLLN